MARCQLVPLLCLINQCSQYAVLLEKMESFYWYSFILKREGHTTSRVTAAKYTSRIGRKIGGQENASEVVLVLHDHTLHKLLSLPHVMQLSIFTCSELTFPPVCKMTILTVTVVSVNFNLKRY